MNDSKTGIEIERKYIRALPAEDSYEGLCEYSRSEIVQVYLKSPLGITHRVRKRTAGGVSRYYETTKVRIDAISAEEREREISEKEFSALLELSDTSRRPIVKTRHAFIFGSQLFEIDVYPDWKKTCILETELESRDSSVDFPPFIRIIREVSGERAYSNAAMAKSFPKEDEI